MNCDNYEIGNGLTSYFWFEGKTLYSEQINDNRYSLNNTLSSP